MLSGSNPRFRLVFSSEPWPPGSHRVLTGNQVRGRPVDGGDPSSRERRLPFGLCLRGQIAPSPVYRTGKGVRLPRPRQGTTQPLRLPPPPRRRFAKEALFASPARARLPHTAPSQVPFEPPPRGDDEAEAMAEARRALGVLPTAHTCENVLEFPNYWALLLRSEGLSPAGHGLDLPKQHVGTSLVSAFCIINGGVP